MIDREFHVAATRQLLRWNPVVAILGARQVGKTTLAHQIATRWRGQIARFDLENPTHRAQLADPMLALENLRGLVVLDEVQHVPEIFRVLRVLADRDRTPARFLVLGSASIELLRQGSESLAGRIAFHELPPLSLAEVGADTWEKLWLRGGFPRSFTARSPAESHAWRQGFVRTFLERDIPQLGIKIASATLERFWQMLTHYHGQRWNASELGRAFGVSDTTVRGYLDLLTATFVVRQLKPWAENLGKRQVKAPKVYIADSGLLHALLGIATSDDLVRHPQVGASFEGFALAAVEQRLRVARGESFFWATQAGAELDLLVVHGKRRLGFEFKRSSAPELTRSMHIALEDLKLDKLVVVHAGRDSYPLAKRVRAIPLRAVVEEIEPLRK